MGGVDGAGIIEDAPPPSASGAFWCPNSLVKRRRAVVPVWPDMERNRVTSIREKKGGQNPCTSDRRSCNRAWGCPDQFNALPTYGRAFQFRRRTALEKRKG